jgi:hypothetical protein
MGGCWWRVIGCRALQSFTTLFGSLISVGHHKESLVHRIIFCALIALVVSSCVTGERMQSVSDGMSKEEVISLLGNPDGFQRAGNYEALRYTNRLISG